MLKKILQMSALASVLAISVAMPVSAAVNEEDAAAPVGSFTSDMPVPMSLRAANQSLRQQWFARHMQERMMHRASLDQAPAVNAR